MEKIQESAKFAFLNRGVAQSGSVHVWGACGRRFKSCHPDYFPVKMNKNQHFKYKMRRRPDNNALHDILD